VEAVHYVEQWLQTLPPIVVYLVAQKQIMRGVALTGVKG